MNKRDSSMKRPAISFAVFAALICAPGVWSELRAPSPRPVELSSLVILTVTLIVLVWYAYDTNQIARATSDRWLREGVLSTAYNLAMPGASVGDVGRILVQIANGSPLVVKARINFNFRVYGQPVSAGSLCDGQEPWLLYPNQMSQC